MSLTDCYDKIYEQGMSDLELTPEKFIPHPGRILVKVAPPDTKTKGGLHLPDVAQRGKNFGVVLAVGETPDKPVPYKRGDVIYFRALGGEVIPFDEHKDIVLLDYADDISCDILAKLDVDAADVGV